MLRLRTWLLLGLFAVLALAGIAVARGVPNSSSFVSASNSGTIAKSKASTTSCTGADGTYEQARGAYNGTLTGTPASPAQSRSACRAGSTRRLTVASSAASGVSRRPAPGTARAGWKP